MTKADVTIVDYGVGNLLSVQRAFENCGATVEITSNPEIIMESNRLVLPGVGAFPKAMKALENLNLIKVIFDYGQSNKPLLAICLGMQLLMDTSNEFGLSTGLGLISGKVIAIPKVSVVGETLKIPNIGWKNLLYSDNTNSISESILKNLEYVSSVYFVHSFMVQTSNPDHQLAHISYGGNIITAVIKKGKITGCQFHPEKSGTVGLQILKNFAGQ